MPRLALLACLVVAGSPSPGRAYFAGFGAPVGHGIEIEIEMVGDRTVKGTLALVAIEFDCDLGKYELEPGKIRSIRFAPPEGELPIIPGTNDAIVPATVTARSGEELVGRVWLRDWKIQTDLGRLTPEAKSLRTLTFSEGIGLGMAPAAAVDGTIRFNGRPIPATVLLQPRAGDPIRAPVGPDGRFRIEAVPPGEYRVSFEAAGLPSRYADPKRTTLTISVRAVGPNTFDFELKAPAIRP